jgi:hypothetical protein
MRLSLVLPAAVVVRLTLPLSALAQEEITFPTLNEDGATVYADRYAHAGERSRGTVLLFHDTRSGAQEYADIVPPPGRPGLRGCRCRPEDGLRQSHLPDHQGLREHLRYGIPDAEGALAWARQELPDDPILLVGSGISADFVIVMAANDPESIAGVLAFSPPSQLAYSDEAEAASRLTVPLFVSYGTMPTDELATVSKIADAAPRELLTLHTPQVGAHGVATLTESGNTEGWEANWAAVEEFLNRVAP